MEDFKLEGDDIRKLYALYSETGNGYSFVIKALELYPILTRSEAWIVWQAFNTPLEREL